jgi:Uma2 family endonuclease
LARLFIHRLGDRIILAPQNPVRLSQRSEPQPDIAVLKPRADFYAGAHPGPGDVLLVVEVADSTVDFDRDVKAPLYARYGLPEMWLVNLAEGQLEVYRQPAPTGYADRRTLARGAEITLLAFPDVSVAVNEILG